MLMFYFFQTCCFEVLYGQLWNVLHFYVPDGRRFFKCNKNRCSFGVNFIICTRNLELILLFCFKQCVLGLSGLLGLNPVIIFFTFTTMQLLLGDVSLLFVCLLARPLLLCWQKGVQFCVWMYWVPL